MAKLSSSIRWPRALSISIHGEPLLFLLALISVFSLLTHELSRHSALAADFEGFDAEEFEDDEDSSLSLPSIPSSNPVTSTLTQSSTPESHHGPPPPSPPSDLPMKEPSLDFWDEDEFEGIPSQKPEQVPILDSPSSDLNVLSSPPPDPPSIRSYTIEIVCVSFLIMFIINYFTGKRQNELIALSWASSFATRDSIFDKNFSLLGTGDGKEDAPLLLKEGQDVFKFYASGRRFCQGLLATMELKGRHDLVARALDLVFPKKDTITFQVVMNEDTMDHVVLAMARKKMAKAMQKEARDLSRFATTVAAGPPSARKWVSEDLMVVTESKEVAGDLITDVVVEQVFGEKAFATLGKWFISLHFSDQQPGSHRKILEFKFALPDASNMADITRLVALVPYYIDVIGRYKLSSQARAKTEAARAKAAQEAYKELQSARLEALQRKKVEKKKMMEEAEAKLSADALRKKEEKERARQMKKSGPRVKMLR